MHSLTSPTTLLTTLLLLTAPTLSVPTALPKTLSTIPPNQQSCTAQGIGAPGATLLYHYKIHIGIKHNAAVCGAVSDLLAKKGGAVTSLTCKDDGYGMTLLKFNNLVDQGEKVNEILDGVWGDIKRNGGFNCPDR